jgi:hypothetical protein
MRKNIFVIGLDPFHLEMVKRIRHAENYAFHGLLDYDEVITPIDYPLARMLEKAERQLRDFPGTVDAIIVHWDFPASTMLPILCGRFGLRSATLESVLKCEHKYWARLEQQRSIPEYTPRFAPVDPFDDDALSRIDIDYPFWLKPVKSFASHLGFRIDSEEDFNRAIPVIRRNIRRLGDAFNVILGYADLPAEVAPIDGNHCIAEEIIAGKQCGLEGFVYQGKVRIHGVIDGVKDANNWSFTRWEYPSVWPEEVQRRMRAATERFMKHIGFDNSAFGIEFFWNEETDELGVLEVNTRISQSHSDQFIKVEGVSNHEVSVDLALGREPEFCLNQGKYKCAAKFLLRKYADATVSRVPTDADIRAIEGGIADSTVKVLVKDGMRLSELRDQDSYSYEIANIFLGAQDQGELLEKYYDVAHRLRFEFSDGTPPEELQFAWVRY